MIETLLSVQLLSNPYFWLCAGIALLIVDIFIGFVLLYFSLPSIFLAGLLFLGRLLPDIGVLMDEWTEALAIYAGLVVVFILVMRLFAKFSSKEGPDINEY